MAKELPYFRFTVSEWLNGTITIDYYPDLPEKNFSLQGVFLAACCYYWMSDCNMTKQMLSKRLAKASDLLEKLFSEKIIKHFEDSDLIEISFLKEQFLPLKQISEQRTIFGKRGGQAKAKQKVSLSQAKGKLKPIYKDKDKDKDKDNNKEKEIYDKYLSSFIEITGKNIRVLSEKTQGHINARLAEGYKIEDLIQVVINIKNDPFHISENLKYLTPEFATRTDKFVKYLNVAPAKQIPQQKDATYKDMEIPGWRR